MHHVNPSNEPREKLGYRCILIVPGDQAGLFQPALACGADAVCFDLEASVAPGQRPAARAAVAEFLSDRPETSVDLLVRMNPPDSDGWKEDVAAIAKARPDHLMIPQVRSEEVLKWVADMFGGDLGLLPMIETAEGLDKVTWIGAATPAVRGLLFGGYDLALELGCLPSWDALHYARSRLVHAAALNGITAFDMPSRTIDDPDALRSESRWAAGMGFVGKMAVHPAQVPIILEVFSPSHDELAWAQQVMGLASAGEVGTMVVDGLVIDRPIIEAARRILARAGGALAGAGVP